MTLLRDTELRLLLVDGKFDEFNQRAGDDPPDLENASLRALDLREADLSHANLRGAYLRSCDLRGVDMRNADLEHATLNGARVSGALFPKNISSGELALSLQHGTCLRTRPPQSG